MRVASLRREAMQTKEDKLSAEQNYRNWFLEKLKSKKDSELRNMPCYCSSGKKYKKCCRNKHHKKQIEALAEMILEAQKIYCK